MPAASPADPTPPVVNTTGAAAVIDITKKRRRRTQTAQQAVRGRWNMRGSEPEHAPHQDDPLRQLAESHERTFNEAGLTLTDAETAAAYKVTLRIAAQTLQGAREQGIVDEPQRTRLAQLLEFMEDLPGLLA